MNNSNDTQNTIDIQQIKSLIYDSMLGEGVFSKQYFSSVICSIFHTIPNSDKCCITYGDFNGLGNINIKYGHEAGDKAVKDSLDIIRTSMPEGTLICRIAGDEFAFISPGQTKTDIKPCIDNINLTLNKKRKQLYGLSIALASVDNHTFTSSSARFEHLYLIAEMLVEEQKKTSKQNQLLSPEETLQEKLTIAIKRFIDYYRFDDTSFQEQFIQVFRKHIKKITEDNELQNIVHNSKNPLENDNLQLKFLINTEPTFPIDVAKNIHSTLTLPSTSANLQNEITDDNWSTLREHLIKHPLTGLDSQKCFDKIILPEIINGNSTELTVHLFDIMHMKLSNDLHGHSATDEQMKAIIDSLTESISDINPNARFIMNGGTLLVIEKPFDYSQYDLFNHIDSSKKLTNFTPTTNEVAYDFSISETTKKKASSLGYVYPLEQQLSPYSKIISKATKNQKTLNLAHSYIQCNSQDILAAIEQLKLNIASQKKEIKALKMSKDSSTMYLALKTALSDAFTYYWNNFSNQCAKKNILLPNLIEAINKSFFSTLQTNYNAYLSAKDKDPR